MIIEQTRLSKYKVLKCGEVVRDAMVRDIPEVFEGVEQEKRKGIFI